MKSKLRFSLKWFLVVSSVTGVLFGLYVKRTSDQRRVVALINTFDPNAKASRIEYDYEFDDDGSPIPDAKSAVPNILLDAFGSASFHSIVGVTLDGARADISDIESLTSLPNLRRLDLEYNALDDAALQTVAKLTNLERLDLQETNIADDGVKCVEPLTRLKIFMISGAQITDRSLSHFANATNLESLAFRSTSLRGHGLRHLNCADSLRSLDLRGSPVGDDAIPFIVQFKLLEKLNLSGARLSEEALMRVAELEELASLVLPKNISDEILHALRQALPKCEIQP